jgi:hypothetical protein
MKGEMHGNLGAILVPNGNLQHYTTLNAPMFEATTCPRVFLDVCPISCSNNSVRAEEPF